jgi:hypothetical protein
MEREKRKYKVHRVKEYRFIDIKWFVTNPFCGLICLKCNCYIPKQSGMLSTGLKHHLWNPTHIKNLPVHDKGDLILEGEFESIIQKILIHHKNCIEALARNICKKAVTNDKAFLDQYVVTTDADSTSTAKYATNCSIVQVF